MIIYYILLTLLCYSGVILYWETRCSQSSVKEQEILVLFLRHSVQNLRFFFVQRNIDGVNNCTVNSNLTFTPQILYSTRNQERICPLLYNYIIQIRKGTLTDRGFFFLPELTEQKQTTNDWLYACTSSKENDFLHIFLLVNFKSPLIFLSCICSFYASSPRR